VNLAITLIYFKEGIGKEFLPQHHGSCHWKILIGKEIVKDILMTLVI
jgi:hypothetical protein